MGAAIQMKRIIRKSKTQGMDAITRYRSIIVNVKSHSMVTTIRIAEKCVQS